MTSPRPAPPPTRLYTVPIQPKSELQLRFNKTINRAEFAFDRAIFAGDINEAEALIGESLNSLSMYDRADINRSEIARLAMKEIAIPLYARSVYDAQKLDTIALDQEVSEVYFNTLQLISYFKDLYSQATSRPGNQNLETIQGLRGALSELLVFALSTYGQGQTEDRFIPLPSSRSQDRNQTNDDGLNRNFDFIVRERTEALAAKVQVKTSAAHTVNYDPSILVVTTEQLAGDGMSLRALINAMVRGAHGESTADDLQRIEETANSLAALYEGHMIRFGQKAITATNL